MIDNIPKHVAIIMDGNGRWAKQRGLQRIEGHIQGYSNLRDIVRAASEIDIKYLTVYAFSSENWNRPKEEVNTLMDLFAAAAAAELDMMKEKNVKIITSGRINELPQNVRDQFAIDCEQTKNNTGITLNIAINYGGRNEITDAAKAISEKVISGEISIDDIDDMIFSQYLYHPELPDPDLLIRTSGELRISNFLLWQTAYTEIYVTETLWPDFTKKELLKAIESYSQRTRRFGKVLEDE